MLRVCKSSASDRASRASPRQSPPAAPTRRCREVRAVQLRRPAVRRLRQSLLLRPRRNQRPLPRPRTPLAPIPPQTQRLARYPQLQVLPLHRQAPPNRPSANRLINASWGFGALARRVLPIRSMERNNPLVETRCARCNSPMTCNPDGKCWCAELPPRKTLATEGGCLCPSCLEHDLKAEREETALKNRTKSLG